MLLRGEKRELEAIARACAVPTLKTVTVDVFDTTLLRDIQPEDLLFLQVAERWLPFLRPALDAGLTPEEVYYARLKTRQQLFVENRRQAQGDQFLDVGLTSWFTAIVRTLAQELAVDLSAAQVAALVEQMIPIELAINAQVLMPHQTLLDRLAEIKRRRPYLKIYFLSDTYLTKPQLNFLLQQNRVELFDGGIASFDVNYVKANGSLFTHLADPDLFGPDFALAHNLHMGDNHHSDYQMARQAGSAAVWLKSQAERVARAGRRGQRRLKVRLGQT